MKVRAKKMGYYGHRRIYAGQVFELVAYEIPQEEKDSVKITAEQQYSKIWMEKVTEEAPVDPEKRSRKIISRANDKEVI
jgi:hypothetical protein